MPRRFFFVPLLFGIETVCWAEVVQELNDFVEVAQELNDFVEVAQELNDFVEAVLTNVCAEMSALKCLR